MVEIGVNGLDETFTGTTAAETLRGAAGNSADILIGGLGADWLRGMGGNDQLSAWPAAGTATDSAGADHVLWSNAVEARDVVEGFAPGEDLLVFSAAGFGGGLAASGLAAGSFRSALTGTSDSAAGVGQFVFETDAARLWWDADGAGGPAQLIATFSAGLALDAGSFRIIA